MVPSVSLPCSKEWRSALMPTTTPWGIEGTLMETIHILGDLTRNAAAECAGAGKAALTLVRLGRTDAAQQVEMVAHGHWRRFNTLWDAAVAQRDHAST